MVQEFKVFLYTIMIAMLMALSFLIYISCSNLNGVSEVDPWDKGCDSCAYARSKDSTTAAGCYTAWSTYLNDWAEFCPDKTPNAPQ